jgi:transposase-like protein
MNKYTPKWIFRVIVLGPRGWLSLLLVVSLVCGLSFSPDTAPSREEGWLPETRGGRLRWPASRMGRWVWRACRLIQASSVRLACRVGLMLGLVEASGIREAYPTGWLLVGLAVIDWGLSLAGIMWPGLLSRPWYRQMREDSHQMYRWSVMGLSALALQRGLAGVSLVVGQMVTCEHGDSRVELEAHTRPDGQATYRVRLIGKFEYEVTPQDEFEKRALILDLRRLRTPDRAEHRWGIVTQEALAQVFGVFQEHISRWEGYRREGQWANLLSLNSKSLLTDDLRQQIVQVWAPNIWQTAEQVRGQLAQQGVTVARRVVEEAGRQSGLMEIRAHLKAQWINTANGMRPRETYLLEQAFGLIDQQQAQLEQAQAIALETKVDVAAWRALAGRPQAEKRLEKPWPWLFQVEHLLFGYWQPLEEGSVGCIYCGSAQVALKSRKPRLKAYLDEHGQRQTVEVYRYYCQNPDCPYQTFTNLPPGLMPHSVWSLDARLRALELYAGLRTTYRASAAALGVSPATLYHWLARFGQQPLQVAALFGLVRTSGVVGIDEKYVKVPKNDKADSPQRKWMYVYVAVDAHTLDLLHINLYPHLGKDSAHLFLLELRAKGYHPHVILTDLNQDYAEPLAAVFPNAIHHQCVFHALQSWHRSFKRIFGRDYAASQPHLFELRRQIDRIFQAKTRRTVKKRYAQLMTQREQLLQSEPRLQPILDSLERHYPYLLNAYDNPLIPFTNNATERLIRRFDQHYQNFAGFDSLHTARCYLYIFELTYRFTPFGREVQPHLRGKCPLELAGYDLSNVPLARYLREHSLVPLVSSRPELVPR